MLIEMRDKIRAHQDSAAARLPACTVVNTPALQSLGGTPHTALSPLL